MICAVRDFLIGVSREVKNWSIGRRLGAGFLVVVLDHGGAGGGRCAIQVRNIDNKLTVINDQNAVKQRFAINFRGSVHDRAIAIRDVRVGRRPRRDRQTRST